MQKKVFFVLLCLISMVWGCFMQSSNTVDRITEVTTADSGSLSVNLNFGSSKISEKAPIGVTKIEIDINGWKVLFVAAEGSGLIEGVPVGSATLKARGLDSGGTELYKASASINIIAGEVAIVNLMFEPNISFVARTGSTSGPDIVNGSAANPTIGTAYQVEQNVLDTRTFYIVNNGGIPVSYPVDPASVSNTDYFNIGVQPSAAGTLNPGDSFSFTVQFNSTDSLPNSYATEVDIQIDNGSFIFDISVVLTSPVLGPEMEVRFDTDTGTVVAFSSTPDQSDGTIMLQYDTASHIEHTFFIKNIGSQDLIVSGSPVIVLGGN
ncbi:hypothetical protein KAJ27_11350, partial [bacterium]|nr:hypothetical protein [bacterium]